MGFRVGRGCKAITSAVLWDQSPNRLTATSGRAAPLSLTVLVNKVEVTQDPAPAGSQGSMRGGAQ